MRLCPSCNSLTETNQYFGIEICTNDKCNWNDNTIQRMRLLKDKIFNDRNLFIKYEAFIIQLIKDNEEK